MPPPSVGVAVITHHAKHHLSSCLPPLLNSTLNPRVLVVNSSSNDGTVEKANEIGAESMVIPRAAFNHGTTRELARRFLKTDIVVMMTPDAYAVDERMLEHLIQPIIDKKASISYARQIPHFNADFFESFARTFNYPDKSQIRTIQDAKEYGVYTFFCSDSCAAYSNDALDEIGGFQDVLIGEDTVAAALLLKKGHAIAYVAEAIVHHSHRYTLKQEFQRHFDTGLARQSYGHLFKGIGKDSDRGQLYVSQLLKTLTNEHPYLIPYACLQCFIKWFGYRLGYASKNAPKKWKAFFSGQDFYWS